MPNFCASISGRLARRRAVAAVGGGELHRLRVAIDDLAKTAYADHPMAALTCWEADALARVLALGGHVDKATDLLVGHSYHDDEEDDSHYYERDTPPKVRKAELRELAEWLASF